MQALLLGVSLQKLLVPFSATFSDVSLINLRGRAETLNRGFVHLSGSCVCKPTSGQTASFKMPGKGVRWVVSSDA